MVKRHGRARLAAVTAEMARHRTGNHEQVAWAGRQAVRRQDGTMACVAIEACSTAGVES